MKDPKAIFKKYCKKRKMRYTPERDMIIEEIYRKDEHFGIDDLFLRIRIRNPTIKLSKGSIYRSIPYLIDANLIRESLTDEGHVCYEHILGHEHHDHIKCIGCGKIFEFYEEDIDKLEQKLCKGLKFKMLWHMHVIMGYCSKCLEKKRQENEKKE